MKSLLVYSWSMASISLLALGACGGLSPSSEIPFAAGKSRSTPIKHIVLIVQENRSFDNLFATFPGADGAKRGKEKTKNGDKWVTLAAKPLITKSDGQYYDLQHCHASFETDFDAGQMDGFNLEGKGVCPNAPPAKLLPYQYVNPSQIAPYWDIARSWVLADNMFQTQASGSFTAHQDLIRGDTCIQSCVSPSSDTLSLIDNPTYWPWGCDAGKNVKTHTINIYGQESSGATGPYPCSNHFPTYKNGGYKTLADRMDAAGVSWKYYTPCFSGSDQPSCSPSSDCGDGVNTCDADLLDAFDVIYPVRDGAEWGKNVTWPETNIFSDLTGKAFPSVSWVIPEDDESDHPGEKNDLGPEWVASVVNAIGKSSYWKSSVIIVIWDDWGGFYDHVPPPFQDQLGGLGFRVPMLLISPYAIAGTNGGLVAHTQYEYGSILKYIEQNWNLPSLGTTDARSTSIGNVLNYKQPPRAFTAIPSSMDARYFIRKPHLPQHGDPQ